MRTGRPKVALLLTDDERRRLDSLAHRSRSAPHVARRARIILACAEGTDSKVGKRRVDLGRDVANNQPGRHLRQPGAHRKNRSRVIEFFHDGGGHEHTGVHRWQDVRTG